MQNGTARVLFDTSALIELFDSTKIGKEVEQMLIQANEVLLPPVVMAELISKLARKGFEPEVFVSKLENLATIPSMDIEIAKRAGELHSQLRKKSANVSLIVCIIIAHAEQEDAVVVTTDTHFKPYKQSKIL